MLTVLGRRRYDNERSYDHKGHPEDKPGNRSPGQRIDGRLDKPELPRAMHELNDMIILAPPCHPWEPVKVPEEATARVHCLICGEPFAA
jgi:hypothetical protein